MNDTLRDKSWEHFGIKWSSFRKQVYVAQNGINFVILVLNFGSLNHEAWNSNILEKKLNFK